MKDLFLRICCMLTLNEYELLKQSSPFSRKQVKREGMAILIPMITWLFLGFLLVFRIQGSYVHASLAAIIAMLFIGLIELQIVSIQEKNSWLIGMRLIVALIIAFLTALFVDDIVFDENIKDELALMEQEAIKEVEESTQLSWENENSTLLSEIKKAQQDVDTIKSKHQNEIQGKDGRPAGVGTVAAKLEGYVMEEKATLDSLVAKRTALEKELQKELSAQRLDTKVLFSEVGPLSRIKALWRLVTREKAVLFVYLLFFLFMTSLELFVLFSKIGDPTDYQLKMSLTKDYEKARLAVLRKDFNKVLQNQVMLEGSEKYLRDR